MLDALASLNEVLVDRWRLHMRCVSAIVRCRCLDDLSTNTVCSIGTFFDLDKFNCLLNFCSLLCLGLLVRLFPLMLG